MANDFAWMSQGGLLLDGTGDISLSGGIDTVVSMVRTRLKAAVDGWKLYKIGAGLDQFPGSTADAEAEVAIQRQVLNAISSGFLPTNVFRVTTLRFGNVIQVYVYLSDQLIGQASVNFNNTNVVGQ